MLGCHDHCIGIQRKARGGILLVILIGPSILNHNAHASLMKQFEIISSTFSLVLRKSRNCIIINGNELIFRTFHSIFASACHILAALSLLDYPLPPLPHIV